MSRPNLDGFYVGRDVYLLKKSLGFNFGAAFSSGERNGPHLAALCEGQTNERTLEQKLDATQRLW